MKWLLFVLSLCASAATAQVIDVEASRFLSAPHARSGCYSPYRLTINELQDIETIEVRSIANGVVLRTNIAVGGVSEARVVVPAYVGKGSRVEVGEDSITPKLPPRRVEPDYARPYVAVFSHDPVYARAVMPSAPTRMVCDYFEIREFFTDWRLLDAYDALVIFNPSDVRLPEGSQRTIAEFCSLGGAVFIAGSFRFGEKAVDLPAPGPVTTLTINDLNVQRFRYGPGAIYRVGWSDLERGTNAQIKVTRTLQDHIWFGGNSAPGGGPPSRVPASRAIYPKPKAVESTSPGIWFWGLAGALVLLCGIGPVAAARVSKGLWSAHLVVIVGSALIGLLALLQPRPVPTVELSVITFTGETAASSTATYVVAQEAWGETMAIDLASADRRLPKSLPGADGWNAWLVFEPLASTNAAGDKLVQLANGRVGELTFRDFSTQAHRGNSIFSDGEPALLEQWLEANAYRGRFASLAPVDVPEIGEADYGRAKVIMRGGILIRNTGQPR